MSNGLGNDEHLALRESLGAYALGQLGPREAAAIRAHLDGCPACRAELASVMPAAGALTAAAGRPAAAPEPPPGLEEEIIGRIRAEATAAGAPEVDLPTTVVALRRPRRATVGRAGLVAAAAVVVAAVAGAGLGFIAGSPTAVPSEAVAVRAIDRPIQASARFIDHTWGTEINLAADGFERGAVYRVVVVDSAGRQVDAGRFVGTGDQRMRCNLNSSVLRADATGFDVIDDTGAVVLAGRV